MSVRIKRADGTWQFLTGTGPIGVPGLMGPPGVNGEDGEEGWWIPPAVAPGAGLVRLAQIIATGSQATVDFTSISGAYSTLKVIWNARDTQAGTNSVVMRVRFNNDSTAANYTVAQYQGSQNGGAIVGAVASSTSGVFVSGNPQDGNTAGLFSAVEFTIPGYASTTWHKRYESLATYEDGTGNLTNLKLTARWASTAAITRITFLTDGTAFKDGSTFTLYGLP